MIYKQTLHHWLSITKSIGETVTLCGWSAKQTLARNQTKSLDSSSPTRQEAWEGRQLEKEPREVSLWRKTQRGSRERTAEDQSRWVSSPESTTVSRRKQWGKTSQDELAFLVALLKFRAKYTPALVYRCTWNAVSENYPSCSWSWPKPILFVCSFSSTPSVVSLMVVKKCVTSPVRNEKKTTRRITSHEKFNDFDIVGGRPTGVTRLPVAKNLECCFKVSMFELQSLDKLHFWTNILGKGMTLSSPRLWVNN